MDEILGTDDKIVIAGDRRLESLGELSGWLISTVSNCWFGILAVASACSNLAGQSLYWSTDLARLLNDHGKRHTQWHRRCVLSTFRIMTRPNNADIFVVPMIHLIPHGAIQSFTILRRISPVTRSASDYVQFFTNCRYFPFFSWINRLAVW